MPGKEGTSCANRVPVPQRGVGSCGPITLIAVGWSCGPTADEGDGTAGANPPPRLFVEANGSRGSGARSQAGASLGPIAPHLRQPVRKSQVFGTRELRRLQALCSSICRSLRHT